MTYKKLFPTIPLGFKAYLIAPQAHFVYERAGYLGREKMMSGQIDTTLLGVSTDDYGACADTGSF